MATSSFTSLRSVAFVALLIAESIVGIAVGVPSACAQEVLDGIAAVVNDDVVNAVAHVAAILDGEALRVSRLKNLDLIIENLRRDLAGQ